MVGSRPAIVIRRRIILSRDRFVFWASFRNNLLIFAVTVIPTAIGLLLSYSCSATLRSSSGKTVALRRLLSSADSSGRHCGDRVGMDFESDPRRAQLYFQISGARCPRDELARDSDCPLVWASCGSRWLRWSLLSALRGDPTGSRRGGRHWGHKLVINLMYGRRYSSSCTSTIYAQTLSQIYVLTREDREPRPWCPPTSRTRTFEKANVGYGSAIAMIMTAIIIVLEVAFITRQQKLAGEGNTDETNRIRLHAGRTLSPLSAARHAVSFLHRVHKRV